MVHNRTHPGAEKRTRTIIIPKGTINPNETNVIEIPPNLKNSTTLIAKQPKGPNKPSRAQALPAWNDAFSVTLPMACSGMQTSMQQNPLQDASVLRPRTSSLNRSYPAQVQSHRPRSSSGQSYRSSRSDGSSNRSQNLQGVSCPAAMVDHSVMARPRAMHTTYPPAAGGRRSVSPAASPQHGMRRGNAMSNLDESFQHEFNPPFTSTLGTPPGYHSYDYGPSSVYDDTNFDFLMDSGGSRSKSAHRASCPMAAMSQPIPKVAHSGNPKSYSAPANLRTEYPGPSRSQTYASFKPSHTSTQINDYDNATPPSGFYECSSTYESDYPNLRVHTKSVRSDPSLGSFMEEFSTTIDSSGEIDDSLLAKIMSGQHNVIKQMAPSPTKTSAQDCRAQGQQANATYVRQQNVPQNATFARPGPANATFVRPATANTTYACPAANATYARPANARAADATFARPGNATFARPGNATFARPANATFNRPARTAPANATFSRPGQANATYVCPAANATYVRPRQANETFVRPRQANETFVRPRQANETFVRPRQANQTFVRPRQANETFVRQKPANATFVRQAPANATFARPGPANTTFVRPESANRTFVRPAQANATFACPGAAQTNATFARHGPGDATFTRPSQTKYSRVSNTSFVGPTTNATYSKRGNVTFESDGSGSRSWPSSDFSGYEDSSGELDDSMLGKLMAGEYNVISNMTASPPRARDATYNCNCAEDDNEMDSSGSFSIDPNVSFETFTEEIVYSSSRLD